MVALSFGAAGCGALIGSLNGFGDIGPTARQHLRPIPVSKKVCPYVRVMHKAANDFQLVNPIAHLFSSSRLPPDAKWPKQRARIGARLKVLEFSVAASRPQFPAPIQRRFDIVLTNIRKGRPVVARSKTFLDVVVSDDTYFSDGQTAFGEASDLIGDACAVHLAANPLSVLERPRRRAAAG